MTWDVQRIQQPHLQPAQLQQQWFSGRQAAAVEGLNAGLTARALPWGVFWSTQVKLGRGPAPAAWVPAAAAAAAVVVAGQCSGGGLCCGRATATAPKQLLQPAVHHVCARSSSTCDNRRAACIYWSQQQPPNSAAAARAAKRLHQVLCPSYAMHAAQQLQQQQQGHSRCTWGRCSPTLAAPPPVGHQHLCGHCVFMCMFMCMFMFMWPARLNQQLRHSCKASQQARPVLTAFGA